jgi:hypothetical protein
MNRESNCFSGIQSTSSIPQWIGVGLLSIVLSACGGSSDGNVDNGNSTVIPGTSDIFGENDFKIGESIEIIVKTDATGFDWTQTAGPSVNIIAPQSKVLAFTANEAGTYSFQVTSSENTRVVSFDITDEVAPMTARLSHMVQEGNKVSLRAWNNDNEERAFSWNQIEGPSVELTGYEDGDIAIFFDSPSVATDTIISFEVTGEVNASSYTDIVSVLVEDTPAIPNNVRFEERVATVYPYNPNSAVASDIVDCVYSNTLVDSCRLSQLPLIGQQTANPTLENIMDRVVTSHPWMAERFKTFLETEDVNNDFKNLLRATTAVVISYDVRPSFYWVVSGAIYLDPNNFWITPEERDTINEAPDYRSAFGNDLQFVMPWRWVKNNSYASYYVPSDIRVTRSTQDGLYGLISLMYHELAHANDFFPQSEWFSHNSSSTILNAALDTNFESDGLATSYPLTSSEMYALAQVNFQGETATNTQKSYEPIDVAGFFEPDRASGYYNYSSKREDFAMLFEELMMQSRYQVYRDMAVTNRPTGDNISGDDYIVTWGQRGRAGETKIKPRLEYVTSRVLPEFDVDIAIDNMITPIAMTPGNNWNENLSIGPIVGEKQGKPTFLGGYTLSEPSHSNHYITPGSKPVIDGSKNGYFHKPFMRKTDK